MPDRAETRGPTADASPPQATAAPRAADELDAAAAPTSDKIDDAAGSAGGIRTATADTSDKIDDAAGSAGGIRTATADTSDKIDDAAGGAGGIRAATADAAAAFGAAADEVDDAAAARLGVNRTDLRILGLVGAAGTMTAGTLSSAARLSPAATTAAIQRLVAAGHLRREVDPDDRRRAVVTVTADTAETLDRIYAPIGEAGRQVLDRYSPTELTLITEFLRLGRRMQLEQAERIRTMRDH